ncbi:hypothetical protein GCM10025880_33180 [Methylorubrum aminovorans]|nr:hypothetical protein GCM10025880_33180 [Methylorubrum aminovorans]
MGRRACPPLSHDGLDEELWTEGENSSGLLATDATRADRRLLALRAGGACHGNRIRPGACGATTCMDPLNDNVRSILALATSYKPGTIIMAERVVDAKLDELRGSRARRAAMDALLHELALPTRHARNRGSLFELIELQLKRWHTEIAYLFH